MTRLRIAHIDTERIWRGGEQQLVSLVKKLAENGHHNVVVGRSGSALAEKFDGSTTDYFPVNPCGEWDMVAPRFLRRMLREQRIDVIHAHTSHGLTLGILARRGLGIPVVATRRVDFHLRKNWFSRWKYGNVDRLVAVSTAVKRILREDGIPGEKIHIVPDGVDFSRYEGIVPITREELGFPENSLIIGQVAALVPHKDQNTLLEALALLKPRFPQIKGLFVGEGESQKRLAKRTQAIGLEGTVKFSGFKKDVLRYLAAFDLFCLSSKEEGLGSSLLDAMAMRVPVVATTAGGIPDLIQDHVHGILVAPSNPAKLAEALAEALATKGNNGGMIQRAREKSLTYDINRTASDMDVIYQDLTSANARLD